MKPEPLKRLSGPAPAEVWRLERRVPLALLAALLLQLLTLVAWATWLEARVDRVEHGLNAVSGAGEKFARIEERLEGVRGEIVLLRRALEKFGERLEKR